MELFKKSDSRYGHEVDMERCRVKVWPDHSFSASQCGRKKVVEVEGIGYCRQHSPDAVKARKDQQAAKWAEEQRRSDYRLKRPTEYRDTLRSIAEVTQRQQLPITAQIHALATEALAKWNDLEAR